MSVNTRTDIAILAELGARLARRRLARNLTQDALALNAGVSKRTIERIEAGQSTQMTNLVRVLRSLGLLDNLEALVPTPLPSPIDQLRLRRRERKRASRTSVTAGGTAAPQPVASAPARRSPAKRWTWGDER